jgi:hypothetical protein
MSEAPTTDEQLPDHTFGPWWVDDRREAGGALQVQAKHRGEGSSYCVATVNHWDQPNANARLIAAAPDLLEALKRLARAYVSTMESGRDRIVALGGDCDPVDVMERGDPYLRIAKEAIAKAEGRS